MLAILVASAAISCALAYVVHSRRLQYWLPSYVTERVRRRARGTPGIRHVYFCLADHYEPYGGTTDQSAARSRVAEWVEKYPKIARQHHDSEGRVPQHSFFYPQEEYDVLMDSWRACRAASARSSHLHHDGDTAGDLRAKLRQFVDTLHCRHGLLRRDETGQVVYAFIHGNWALDNSRPDGRWCGVDNELDVLVETGCRVDMTMPSAPSIPGTSDQLHLSRAGLRQAQGTTRRDVAVGEWGRPAAVLQGPLVNWREGSARPAHIEDRDLRDARPTPPPRRAVGRCHVAVQGAEALFVKVHTLGRGRPRCCSAAASRRCGPS
jgi:hypothetical protein